MLIVQFILVPPHFGTQTILTEGSSPLSKILVAPRFSQFLRSRSEIYLLQINAHYFKFSGIIQIVEFF